MMRYFYGGLAFFNLIYVFINIWKVTTSFAPDFLAAVAIGVASANFAVMLFLYVRTVLHHSRTKRGADAD